ncbi:hypothetical protein [Methylibium petroleiphilum]|uniref:hypothetical protein n=1 Tax=Methylibium petroleiphilum TaxID=105560 RepID=UPI0011D0D462|nr:hypothetical protein [Methylibium petroleiphilum]
MNTRTNGSSRDRSAASNRPSGMPAWLHRLTAAGGALAIGLLSAFVIGVGGASPTEASTAAPPALRAPDDRLKRCGQHSDKAERHWCLARSTAEAPRTAHPGL